MNDIEAVVELLNNKIKVLETLLECKDSEINILKDCLKELGTQITVDDMSEPNFADLSNPLSRVEFRRTVLSLQKAYTYSLKDHKLLDKINDALSRVQSENDFKE